jgi:hypothetical protein
MTRPRKPTAILELQGAFKKHPERRAAREHEPVASGPLGDPPECLSKEEKAVWVEISALLPPKVGTNADRIAFELMCRITARMREDGIGERYGISNGEVTALCNLCGRFGMTPADRSKIAVPRPDDADNPFAQIAREGKSQRIQ